MKKLIKKTLAFLVSIPIILYKKLISPLFHHSCRYFPSCSCYALMAIEEHGVIVGLYYTAKRLFSCNPKSKRLSFDIVKLSLKGDNVWLY